ncbi:nucleotide exchange factor GrpE [Clostridium sp. YIM B02515]|uniref:Protein GrpE n=1 Tax=Clostridium rhizosphaerae TaxID=2803861 RepID=A0ABS1T753_9CLOT|nr:nucleotide exchange factor GrpE [Clostridium rhizosphaerae]MBL4935178.1 nucleotide exchange factor GrpE [Clostridium rhizosphaerae]
MEKSNDVKYDDAQQAEILEDQEFEGIDEEEIVSLEGLVEELQSSNRKLLDENNKLENELSAMKERIVRITAEYDNFRKRTAKEKEGIYTDACEDVLKNMFPVLDNLERASNVNGSIEDIKKGIDMTIRQFNDSLSKLQVEEIPTDQGFDPNMHNAVMHIEDENFGEKAVVEVFQKGYKRGEKVLRYSMVKVAN